MGLPFEDFTPGRVWETPGRTVTEADIVAFSGMSGDFNPIHTDETFARTTDFGGRIAHGPMVIGWAFGLMARLDLIDGTALALLEVHWTFLAPVRAGDTLRVRVEVAEARPTSKPDRGVVAFALAVLDGTGETVQAATARVLVRRRPAPASPAP